MESTGPDLGDLVGLLKRRWLVLVLPAAVTTGIAAAVAMILPPVYTSTARVLVESQAIPEDLARSTVTSGAVERIRLIEQRLLARETLLEIARTFNLFADRSGLTPSDIVDLMREAVDIETVVLGTSGRSTVTASAVNISFSASQPEVASRVANDLLNRVLQQNLQQRTARATGTLAFFDREVQRLGNELTAAEAEITAYKAQNDDALPETLSFRLDETSKLEERMFQRDSRRAALEQEMQVLRQPVLAGPPVASREARADPDLVEILRMRQTLDQQRAILAETHPAVRSMVQRLERLEASYAARTGAPAPRTEPGAPDAPPPQPAVPAAAAARIAAIDREMQLLAAQRVVDEERLDALRASIARTAEVEVQLGRLLRSRDAILLQYRDAVTKRAEAAVGERLEVNQQAERLEVIEQPAVPPRPSSPNRPLIVAGGAAGGLALGGGVALLLELMFPFLRTSRDVERRLGMRPFVTVPWIETRRERIWRRIRLALLILIVGASIPAALWYVDTQVMPLVSMWDRAARLSGIGRLIDLVRARFGG
jgi:polysaccharide chain length determinant protein (PEP-CTERM system associated)